MFHTSVRIIEVARGGPEHHGCRAWQRQHRRQGGQRHIALPGANLPTVPFLRMMWPSPVPSALAHTRTKLTHGLKDFSTSFVLSKAILIWLPMHRCM